MRGETSRKSDVRYWRMHWEKKQGNIADTDTVDVHVDAMYFFMVQKHNAPICAPSY